MSILSFGLVLGLTGSLTPGAFTMLLVSQTLRYGIKEGVKVAFAPLVTDFPIIILSTLVLSQIANFKPILGVISILGALFLAYMGYGDIKIKEIDTSIESEKPQSLKKGVITNFLTPAPYMFWLTIGGPTIIKAASNAIVLPILFIVTLYITFISGYIAIVFLVSKSRHLLKSKRYLYTIKGLGAILFIFSFFFLRNGLQLLKLL